MIKPSTSLKSYICSLNCRVMNIRYGYTSHRSWFKIISHHLYHLYVLFGQKNAHSTQVAVLSKVYGWDASQREKLLPGHGLIILVFRNAKNQSRTHSIQNLTNTSQDSHYPWLHPVGWTFTIGNGGLSISYHEIRSIRKNEITVIEKKQAQKAQREGA